MKPGEDVPRQESALPERATATAELARRLAGWFPHTAGRFVRLARIYWWVLLVLLGFLVQVVLVLMVWDLVDLCISLMEVWAELARKHLELTLVVAHPS